MINGGSINGFTLNGASDSGEVLIVVSDGVNVDEYILASSGIELFDGVLCVDSSNASVAWAVEDVASIIDAALASTEMSLAITATTSLNGKLKVFLDFVVSDSLDLSDPLAETINRLVAVSDKLVATGAVSSQLEADILVSVTAALQSSLDHAWGVNVTDNAAISADLTYVFENFLALIANAHIVTGASPGLTLVTTAIDSVAVVSDDASSFISLIEALEDSVSFTGALVLPNGASYTAWVSNLHTGAPFKYLNYPFNSFAVQGERQFGCTADGLFELTGNDDDGDSIAAVVRSGLVDFGTAYIKNMEAAYLGYSADGQLYLKVIDSDGGDKRTVVYTLSETNDAVAENRLELGRGVKARYWQFEVSNVDGADFLIDTLDVLPVILNRRR